MIGIYSGLAYGPLETNFRFLDSLLDGGEGCASPTIFSHSVHNAMAGYLSRVFKITGPVMTFTSFTWPFLIALREAFWALKTGSINRALVVAAEIYSPPLGYALKKLNNKYDHSLDSGAVCWILEAQSKNPQQKNLILQDIQVEEEASEDYWRLLPGKVGSNPFTYPLKHAFELTDRVKKTMSADNSKLLWKSKDVFGKVTLHFCNQ
jgi:hypothetical protein